MITQQAIIIDGHKFVPVSIDISILTILLSQLSIPNINEICDLINDNINLLAVNFSKKYVFASKQKSIIESKEVASLNSKINNLEESLKKTKSDYEQSLIDNDMERSNDLYTFLKNKTELLEELKSDKNRLLSKTSFNVTLDGYKTVTKMYPTDDFEFIYKSQSYLNFSYPEPCLYNTFMNYNIPPKESEIWMPMKSYLDLINFPIVKNRTDCCKVYRDIVFLDLPNREVTFRDFEDYLSCLSLCIRSGPPQLLSWKLNYDPQKAPHNLVNIDGFKVYEYKEPIRAESLNSSKPSFFFMNRQLDSTVLGNTETNDTISLAE